MSQKQKLLALFDKMEAERQEMLTSLEGLDHSLLERKPNPDKWSVSEIFMHMVSAEGGSLKYMRKKIEVNNHSKLGGTTTRFSLLMGALMLPVKIKAPKIVADVGSGVPYKDALDQWNEVRKELRAEYEKIEEDWIGHDLFKHPSAGKFDLIRAVKFMTAHANRHIGQIYRTVKLLE